MAKSGKRVISVNDKPYFFEWLDEDKLRLSNLVIKDLLKFKEWETLSFVQYPSEYKKELLFQDELQGDGVFFGCFPVVEQNGKYVDIIYDGYRKKEDTLKMDLNKDYAIELGQSLNTAVENLNSLGAFYGNNTEKAEKFSKEYSPQSCCFVLNLDKKSGKFKSYICDDGDCDIEVARVDVDDNKIAKSIVELLEKSYINIFKRLKEI